MIVAAIEPGRLLALKLRRPLVEKRANSLAAVLRQETSNLFPNFVFESLREFFIFTCKKRLLHRADGQQRTVSNFLRQYLHFRFELRPRNDLIDEAESERRLRINHVAGIKKLCRFRPPD